MAAQAVPVPPVPPRFPPRSPRIGIVLAAEPCIERSGQLLAGVADDGDPVIEMGPAQRGGITKIRQGAGEASRCCFQLAASSLSETSSRAEIARTEARADAEASALVVL